MLRVTDIVLMTKLILIQHSPTVTRHSPISPFLPIVVAIFLFHQFMKKY